MAENLWAKNDVERDLEQWTRLVDLMGEYVIRLA
jgi:hypothetical protein